MAAISNMQLKLPPEPGVSSAGDVPIAALPIPAAVLDAQGVIIAVNAEWTLAHPHSAPGNDGLDWCSDELREALLGGIQKAIGAGNPRFSHDYGPDNSRRRI